MKKAIIGKKIGMTQIFDEAGKVIPVTIIEAGPCTVAQVKTVESDGYNAIQLGFEDVKESKLNKPEKGHFAKANIAPKKHLREFRVESVEGVTVGTEWTVTEFAEGDVLKEKIEKQNKVPFKESQILDYFIQICLALQYLHKKKIIHNKIQSSNIFLTKSGIVKLGIFNLPIFKNVNITYYRMARDISLYYIPSEELCIKSDIWSLGVLLYELMTFNFPFTAESIPLLSIKMSRGVYKPPPSIYSSEIIDLLKHLLNVQARERPSVDEILKLPIIKNRIKTFLDEVKYNKDLYTKLENEYKEKKNKK